MPERESFTYGTQAAMYIAAKRSNYVDYAPDCSCNDFRNQESSLFDRQGVGQISFVRVCTLIKMHSNDN